MDAEKMKMNTKRMTHKIKSVTFGKVFCPRKTKIISLDWCRKRCKYYTVWGYGDTIVDRCKWGNCRKEVKNDKV